MDTPANGHGFPSASIDRWSMRLSGCGGLAVLGLLLMAAAPRTLGWSVAPSMGTARYAHTSTLVTNDCVLVVGGQANSGALSSCELYNPNTNGWTPSGSLAVARAYHTATFLGNGKVLIVGGLNGGTFLSSPELVDPVTGTSSPAGTMSEPRAFATATLLENGKVLVAGGFNTTNFFLRTSELYDPDSNTWAPAASMSKPREYPAAVRLNNGHVLVSGGIIGDASSTAEIYNPGTNTWSSAGTLTSARYEHTEVLLGNGKVLAVGGLAPDNSILASTDLYDPDTNTWSSGGSMTITRERHTATLLANGTVLVGGGNSGSTLETSSEIYEFGGAGNGWSSGGSMSVARYLHAATLLNDGRVLVTGGAGFSGPLASAEFYQPPVPSVPTAVIAAPSGAIEAGAVVHLDGSGSSDSGGGELTYEWSLEGVALGSGSSLDFAFPLGDNLVKLTVTNSSHLSAFTFVTVHIVDTIAPVLTADTATITVVQASALGTSVFLPWPTAVDSSAGTVPVTATVSSLGVIPAGTSSSGRFLFPVGTTDVTFVASDQSGNSSGAHKRVIVLPDPSVHQIYVSANALTGWNNGGSWQDAFLTLQAALAVAPYGSEIWVAGGTYVPGTAATDSFRMKTGVSLFGGFGGTEWAREQRDWFVNQVFLSGAIVTGFVSAYHVVTGADLAVLDGFTIEHGRAVGPGEDSKGGGMYNANVSPSVRNCVFRFNTATTGGGVHVTGGSPSFAHCTFLANGTTTTDIWDQGGGGMYATVSTVAVSNCFFSQNFAHGPFPAGGGLTVFRSTSTVVNCVFDRNGSDYSAGGFFNAISDSIVTNCTFFGNASFWGGGIANYASPPLTLRNCILWGNIGGGGAHLSNQGNETTFVNCDVEGGFLGAGINPVDARIKDGGGNIALDPLFQNPLQPAGLDNYERSIDDGLRLRNGSPCLNRGTSAGAPVDDIIGVDRSSFGGTPDIGAYEEPFDLPTIYVRTPTREPSMTTQMPSLEFTGEALDGNTLEGIISYSLSGATNQSGTINLARYWRIGVGLQPGVTLLTMGHGGAGGRPAFDRLEITVLAAPDLSGMEFPETIVAGSGQLFSYTIPIPAYPAATITTSALPPGLALVGNTITGVLMSFGDFVVTITAANSVGTVTREIHFRIIPDQPPVAIPVTPDPVEALTRDATPVQLDGTASYDPNGLALSYDWSWNTGSASGAVVTVDMPRGQTEVTLTVTNAFGLSSSTPFLVEVRDSFPPQILYVYPQFPVEATSAAGASVYIPWPMAIDEIDGPVVVKGYSNPRVFPDGREVSGEFTFPLGVTALIFIATDESNNQSPPALIAVVVRDTTAPVLVGVPDDITVEMTDPAGTPVNVPMPTATDICDAAPVVTSNAPTVFPLGTTIVTFTAVDASGNCTKVYRSVTVRDTTPPDTTITSGPPTLTMSTSATFTFTNSQIGGTFLRSLDNGPFEPATSGETLTGLSNGMHVYQVRGVDPSGNIDPSPASYAWTVDLTNPIAGVVNDGTTLDVAFQSSLTTISAVWTGFSDPESDIVGYEWAIGTTPGGTEVQAFAAIGLATSATNSSLVLTQGNTYYVTVRATNGVALQVTKCSNGVTVDANVPKTGVVLDGLAADIKWQSSGTTISANWSGFSDVTSGIVGYEWAIGTVPGGVDVQPFALIGLATSATNPSLALTSGATYYVTVRATNGAGLQSAKSSNGVSVDTSAPVAGLVKDGSSGPDLSTQTSTTTISAHWSGFSDPQSSIAGYEWAIGTVAEGADVQPFTSVGSAKSATNSSLTLNSGTTYYVTVRATNADGLTSTQSSNGVKVR